MFEKPGVLETGYMLVFPNGKYFAHNRDKTRFEVYAQKFDTLEDAAEEVHSYHEDLELRCIQQTFVVLPNFDAEVPEEWKIPDTEERIVYVVASMGPVPIFECPDEENCTSGSSSILKASLFTLSEAEEWRKKRGGKVFKTIIFEKEVELS